jgi:choline dehydrogenase-like flavoprotein
MEIAVPGKEVFDAIVVGSGATGGWAAKQLTEAGLRVALMEAGRALDPQRDFSEHVLPYQVMFRGFSPEMHRTRPIQSTSYACREYNYKWFVNDLKNRYTTPDDKPFNWIRLRILGGRSLVWGRVSLRLSDLDFQAAQHDGYGDNWPIHYADVAPYYDQVEQYIGVSGQAEGVANVPDGKFQPPIPMVCCEVTLRKAVAEKFARHLMFGRYANLTAPLNGRAPCHYCGPCEQGCITHSYFNSPTTTVAAAQATGKLTLFTNAVVSHVMTDPRTGLASGVRYVHRHTREVRELRGRVVILCAQSLESARILLNSSTRQFPNGLTNSSGVLGRYLMDHFSGYGASGFIPTKQPTWEGPPRRPSGTYIARFRNITERQPDFLRGYGYEVYVEPEHPFGAPGFGAEFKQRARQARWMTHLYGYGEILASWENYCELDKNVVDAWGIPALRISMTYGENALKMAPDVAASAAEMLAAAGAEDISLHQKIDYGRHEVGAARMGTDPKKSVLNPFLQAHDVKNLFVMDGCSFVSASCHNPTLTMMALACRACDYLKDQLRRREIPV